MSRDGLALRYEYLIRRVYQCGRHGVDGANADIFRRLNHAEDSFRMDKENQINRRPRLSTKSLEELEYDYDCKCGEVAMYIDRAIRKVASDYAHILHPEQKQILNDCRESLSNPSYDVIEEVLDKSEKVMAELKLSPK